MSNWHFIGDFALGFLLLVVCGVARLRSPEADRSYTTLFQFCIEVGYYSTAYLVVYSVLVGLASWAEHVLLGTAWELVAYLADSPGWIALLMLLITSILPLSAVERRWRRHVHRIGGIPLEAIKLRDLILQVRCEIPEAEVYYSALRRGLDLGNMQALPDHTLHGVLKHAAELRHVLDECAQEHRFASFFADNSRVTHDLKRRFDNLLFRTSRAFAALGGLSSLVDRSSGIADTWDSLGSVVQTEVYTGSTAVLDPAISASRVLLGSLRDEARAVLSDTALLLARLTLQARATERGRVALLRSIGIKAKMQIRPRYQVLLAAFGMVLVLLCIGTVLFGASNAGGSREVAGTIVMVATILVAALLCAIYPKQYFAFANVNAFGRLPYLFFAAAGLAAMVFAFFIGFVFRVLIYQDAERAFAMAYQRSPWLLLSCTSAVLMAILIQDTDDFATVSRRIAHRWRDTYVLALGFVAAGLAAILLLAHTDPENPVPVWAAGFVGVIGGVLGYMVPHRYRYACPQPQPCMPGASKSV